MALTLKDLIELLEISDFRLSELKKQILESFDDYIYMQTLLREQCVDREETLCVSCDDDGECAILTGVIRLILHNNGISPLENNNRSAKSNREIAIAEFESSKRHLQLKSRTWNRVIAMVLLGMALEAEDKRFRALHEYKDAHEVLEKNYLKTHPNEYNQKVIFLEQELMEKLISLSTSRIVPPLESQEPPNPVSAGTPASSDSRSPEADIPPAVEKSDKSVPLFAGEKDYLALFSIPIYGRVEAGPEGVLMLEDSTEPFTMINDVELNGKKYFVYNLHGTSPTDRQINVNAGRTHGWLQVHGLSMNGWEPSFEEGDYVLFFEAKEPSHMDFVIASSKDPAGGSPLIVKRYDHYNGLLLSKSTDANRLYDPIKLDQDHEIRGIVIAIAKPAG